MQKIKVEKSTIKTLRIVEDKCLVTANKVYFVAESCSFIQKKLEEKLK